MRPVVRFVCSAPASSNHLIAVCTARSLAQTRLAIVAMAGQHTPWSLALSASEISTAFWAIDIPSRGQHWDMMIVLMGGIPSSEG
ncbi:hypothetical protein BKK80_13870 [Cupriavidus malaysiensis]|uniref:Uncharacterized protein n=1 Tax=Cupriavidus malaysiensis TaxID=367825 RepID=A0ABM6F917_9BURK|nr:hypothetical protein BKK80_13870 [Cupriavidus malaysiensis]